jgi:hypothetical protein
MMIEHSSGSVARIYECLSLRQPTACLSGQSSTSLGDPVMLPDESPSKLFAWSQYFSGDSRDLESLVGGSPDSCSRLPYADAPSDRRWPGWHVICER